MQGIDYVNVIDGASNGFELLFFFEGALNVIRADGSVILERGDTVINWTTVDSIMDTSQNHS